MRDGMFSHQNASLWASENPRGKRPHPFQHRFSVHVWSGMVGDFLVGPYLLPASPTSADYFIFMQELLPSLCDPEPQYVRPHIWFQHDGLLLIMTDVFVNI